MVSAPDRRPEPVPNVALQSLDVLWFQVAGTICNLACTHCFISCSPTNKTHEFLTLEQVRPYLEEVSPDGKVAEEVEDAWMELFGHIARVMSHGHTFYHVVSAAAPGGRRGG